jgi:hypothetical protein
MSGRDACGTARLQRLASRAIFLVVVPASARFPDYSYPPPFDPHGGKIRSFSGRVFAQIMVLLPKIARVRHARHACGTRTSRVRVGVTSGELLSSRLSFAAFSILAGDGRQARYPG